LIYYGTDINVFDQIRQSGAHIDPFLKGMRAGVLPVQRADKYTLIINLKSARALGVTIRSTLPARADEVMQ
jgi:putative tryptophan/tyrosine transport system substrate-binding protein